MAVTESEIVKGIGSDYEVKFGFHVPEDYFFKSGRGLSHELVDAISSHKDEPDWMRKSRHKSLEYFNARPLPTWGGNVAEIDFENIFYYIKPTENQADAWEDLPADIKDTWDKLGIPEAEKKYLAGVGAQYESEVVYHKLQEELTKQGVLFLDMDSGLREHEDIVRKYFGKIIPPNDNKFAALNSAVWSGGSFIYVPPGVKIEMPLQAYFRINAENMGQFERTQSRRIPPCGWGYDDYYPPYVSVAERKANAAKEMAKLEKEGPDRSRRSTSKAANRHHLLGQGLVRPPGILQRFLQPPAARPHLRPQRLGGRPPDRPRQVTARVAGSELYTVSITIQPRRQALEAISCHLRRPDQFHGRAAPGQALRAASCRS